MKAVRRATVADAPAIYDMLRATARDQGNEHELCVTVDDVRADGFGASPRFHALVAEVDGRVAGLALYFFDYSTWSSRNGLYLEDLYVYADFRRMGVARALMHELASIATANGCGRMNWVVQRGNTRAIQFYESLGAKLLDEWPLWKLDLDVKKS
jgi:GNAT superfamily N-acetyltransferase